MTKAGEERNAGAAVIWSDSTGKDGPEPQNWLAAIIDGSEDAIISKDLTGTIKSWNDAASRLFGYSPEEALGKPITILIPEDRLEEEPRILAQIQQGERVKHFETRRRSKHGSLVDISLTISPIRNADGAIVGASKIARDISERRLAEERQQLLMEEIRHRVKNLFAIAKAIVSISARSSSGTEDIIRTIQARLSSLAQAHELTMTDSLLEPAMDRYVGLLSLLGMLLDPYAADEQIAIEGDDPQVGCNVLPNIALLLHELATNAAKYGALSAREGRLNVSIRRDLDAVHLLWREIGGPKPSPTKEQGFGSRLERALASALNAEILRDWQPGGLVVSIRVPSENLRL